MNALVRFDGNTFYFLSISLLKLPTVVLAVFFVPAMMDNFLKRFWSVIVSHGSFSLHFTVMVPNGKRCI